MNEHVAKRLAGIRQILLGIHHAGHPMSSMTKGVERELFVQSFLAECLPPAYRIGTGDATDVFGHRTGQLDVVIENPFAPNLPISAGNSKTRLYLAEGIAAVIEIKSDLCNQWSEVCDSSAKVAPLKPRFTSRVMTGPGPICSGVPYFAVGYRGWKYMDSLMEKVDAAPGIFGALDIENGFYYSKTQAWAFDEHALWALICEIHQHVSSTISAASRPMDYADGGIDM